MISLYIHIPFCEKKCNYCSFISFVGKNDLQKQYVEALIKELGSHKDKIFNTIFIGGGTPSILYDGAIETILSNVNKTKICEISIECNPNSLTQSKVEEYKLAGVNRVSLGVQSLDDETLKYLGRIHNSEQAVNAIKLLKENFNNINVDLIYGIKTDLAKTLTKIDVPHVSAYNIIYEKGTPLAKAKPLSDDETIAQRELIEKALKKHGVVRYEVSAYARKGFECKHNQNYWECGEYIGVGCAAHSCFNGKRYNSTSDLQNYIKDPLRKYNLTKADLPTERIMLGLRTTKGIELDHPKVDDLVKAGFLKRIDGRIACTTKGFDLLNQIVLKLV